MAKNGDKPEKKLSLYHLFTEAEDGTLSPLADVDARNAEDAVNTYLGDNEATDAPFVIVPDRNLTRVTVEVETVQKVRLTTA